MNLSITHRKPYQPRVEFVERKGVGHPDTICDHLAEELARELASNYLAHTGAVQHFNVDKAVLAAGSVDIGFGGGTHTKASRLVLVGKADFAHEWAPDPEALAVSYKDKLLELLPDATPDAFTVEVWLNQSSVDLQAVVTEATGAPLANDTSFAAVSLPRSALEALVHDVEHHLNSDTFRAVVPVGRDIKVMGARQDDDVRVTVAAPVLARAVTNRSEYDEVVRMVADATHRLSVDAFGDDVIVAVNQADLEDSEYLTLTGTSAEAGDDGQVGRGNRFGGLITPYRPMSLEAAAGKNPAAHVGKTYHAVGSDIAQRLIAESDINEVTVRLLSSIGHPVTDPQAAHIEVVGPHDEAHIAAVVKDCFSDWRGVRDGLIAGEYELY
ncbi:MAG: methionine adenosyltransferase [Acidimicrobiia bacterium]|nr:methionine adenosyltransferase [Acidimicrobiia bacterium]